jgi:hypothetical protein
MENKLEEKYNSVFLYENIWFEGFLFLFEMGVLALNIFCDNFFLTQTNLVQVKVGKKVYFSMVGK